MIFNIYILNYYNIIASVVYDTAALLYIVKEIESRSRQHSGAAMDTADSSMVHLSKFITIKTG